jgi:micrococcal nuclease
MRPLILSILILIFQHSTFTAKVIGITDGDTVIVITEDNNQIKIRLEGIDCPESHQDFGDKAKDATAELCFKKEVRIEKTGTDRYGRTLGYVYVGEVCVNKELLKLGMAWHYKKYNQDPELAKLEDGARSAKIGLWSYPNPIAPWDWRHK